MRMPVDDEATAEIAMTPLIDMMFLLIIFFLVSTAFIDPEKDQSIRLPEVAEGVARRKAPEEMIINVRQGGVLVVSGRIVTLEELQEQLHQAVRTDPNQVVRVRGDAMAYHQQVVRVLEACQKANVKTVSVVTRLKP
jgi:biopolymer transport protein ExbD